MENAELSYIFNGIWNDANWFWLKHVETWSVVHSSNGILIHYIHRNYGVQKMPAKVVEFKKHVFHSPQFEFLNVIICFKCVENSRWVHNLISFIFRLTTYEKFYIDIRATRASRNKTLYFPLSEQQKRRTCMNWVANILPSYLIMQSMSQ